VTVRSVGAAFVEWGTKRVDWRDLVVLEGDEGLGTRFCDALDIV
jgi:hypothetical protein